MMPKSTEFDHQIVDRDAVRRRASIWASLPTRTRLILVVLAIDVLAAIVCCAVMVLNARSAVIVEMNATRATVEPLVADTIRMARNPSPENLLHTLDLRLQTLRHVRVAVFDAKGERIGFVLPNLRRDDHVAPSWFVALIAPPPEQHELPIVVNGSPIGKAVVTAEPLDEIDEVWGYAVSLSLASLLLNLAVLAALAIAFGRVLKPLERLADGLTRLERHDYTAHLDAPASRELAVIAERFNSVAGALGEARAANGRLNRQLLTAQDDEGRRIALELHDEFGPCLFALEANASSIARIADGESTPDRGKLAARAAEIGGIVGQVQARNRELLNRLRPHALGQVPLSECLNLLLADFGRRHPGTAFEGSFEGLARGYGDLVDLTVFRCIQESMTNAVRHGGATHVRAEAHERRGSSGGGLSTLHVVIRDDGTGLPHSHGTGLGLSGMRERVEALDGTFALDNAAPGAVVRIVIPIEPEVAEDVRSEHPPAPPSS
ncbi:ATPase [Methylobacterium sp. C25]|uniref:ATP-binding protein n=1 Tax=Methylobacterium sp. C25 TaxID=2721622 RepID=UPI001F25A2E4|nr:ATP-binding protein [Methylobacterium sp. C25]MCE4222545.1 ATPase [Methylobacterium sp. C25]